MRKCKRCGRDVVEEKDPPSPYVDLKNHQEKIYFCLGCLIWEEYCECEPVWDKSEEKIVKGKI